MKTLNRILFAADAAIDEPGAAAPKPGSLSGFMDGLKGFDPLAKPAAVELAAAPAATPPPKAADGPAKAADAAPAVKDDDEKWPRDAKGWEKFKANRKSERDELTAKIAAAEKKAAELEARLSTAGTPADYEEIKQKLTAKDQALEEYSKQLQVAAVERHPQFVKHFTDRTNAQMELAKRIAGPERAESIKEALSLSEGRQRTAMLDGLLSELSPLNQARIGAVLNELSNIDHEKSVEIAKSGDTFKMLQTRQSEAARQEQAKQQAAWTKTFEEQLAEARKPDAGIFLLQPKDGDAEWNAAVDKRVAEAKNLIFGKNPQPVMAKAAMWAAVAPDLVGYLGKMAKEVETLEAQVKSLKGANPNVRPSTESPANPAAPVTIKPGSGPRDAIAGWMKPLTEHQMGR
jgi:hypothetical protein